MIPFVGQAALALRAQRGGRRRREEAFEALAAGAAPAAVPQVRPGLLPGIESELVSKLIQEWAWGDHSTAALQRLCVRAYHDQEALLRKLDLMDLDREELVEPAQQALRECLPGLHGGR